jgi:hypothetical protein
MLFTKLDQKNECQAFLKVIFVQAPLAHLSGSAYSAENQLPI